MMDKRYLFLACGPFPKKHLPALIETAAACCKQAHREGSTVFTDFMSFHLPTSWLDERPDELISTSLRRSFPGLRFYYDFLFCPGDRVEAFCCPQATHHSVGLRFLARESGARGIPLEKHLF